MQTPSSARWRIIACVPATDGEGIHSAFLDLAKPDTCPSNVQVAVLVNPSLEKFQSTVEAIRPNFVYCAGPSTQQANGQEAVVGAFRFRDPDQQPGGDEALLTALAGAGAELAYVDAAVAPHFGPALHQSGTPHVVVWPSAPAWPPPAIPAAVAAHFNAAFLSFLTSALASPPEAFAAASHSAQSHCAACSPAGGGGSGGAAGGGHGGGSRAAGAGLALPAFVCGGGGSRPALPDSSSIPAPSLALPSGVRPDALGLQGFPGWADVRLLAPRAELRLLLVGPSALLDSERLGFLGEALRALLIMEARTLQLVSSTPLSAPPRNLPPGCSALRCAFRSASGAAGCVVLGAPPSVGARPERAELVQHALRMTLVADSVSLQFRLPPPGLSLPCPRSSPAVAGGLPVVDAVAATSVWAVQLLRELSADPRYHALAALGVAAVGSVADSAFTPNATERFRRLASPSSAAHPGQGQQQPPRPAAIAAASEPAPPADPPSPSPAAADAPGVSTPAANGGTYYGRDALVGYARNGQLQHLQPGGAAAGGGGNCGADAGNQENAPAPPGGAGSGQAAGASASAVPADGGGPGADADTDGGGAEERDQPAGPLSDTRPRFRGELPGYVCRRPPLSCCSEAAFYDDLVEFLTRLRGRPIERSRFPEAVLNGAPLDLFALYREVVSRGGFRVGNGINWKGQVFPRMRNWTESNKQTGVGNALKRHYQNYLMEYEAAHPEDVTLDRCVLCNGGDAAATDWVCCDACEGWAHLSCDRRPGLGSFKDYAQGLGRVYVCPTCTREQEAGEAAVKRQRAA